MLRVSDCIRGGISTAIPQATERVQKSPIASDVKRIIPANAIRILARSCEAGASITKRRDPDKNANVNPRLHRVGKSMPRPIDIAERARH